MMNSAVASKGITVTMRNCKSAALGTQFPVRNEPVMIRLVQAARYLPRARASAALALVIVLALPLAFQQPVIYAQEPLTVTPRPAPTKTPQPTATSVQGDGVLTEEAPPSDAVRSLTQADLSVLTGNVQRPNGIVWFDGKLYATCTGDWTIYELDATTGATQAYIYGVRNSHTLFAERDASNELVLWIPDFQTNELLRVTRNGVQNAASNLNGPWGIAYLDEDAFLVTNLRANTVSRVRRDGQMTDVVTGLVSPTGIARDEDTIYVANNGSTRRSIEWYDVRAAAGDAVETTDATSVSQSLVTGLQNTTGLTMGADGNLYFAYSLGTRGVVGRVDPQQCRENGGCTADQVEIVVLTELAAPIAGLTLTPDMRLYLHTMFSPDIYWVQLEGGAA